MRIHQALDIGRYDIVVLSSPVHWLPDIDEVENSFLKHGLGPSPTVIYGYFAIGMALRTILYRVQCYRRRRLE